MLFRIIVLTAMMIWMGTDSIASEIQFMTHIKDPEFLQATQRTPVKLSDSKGYLVFNRSTPDSVIQQWQEALDQIRQSGRYKQLVQQYLIIK